MEVGSQTNAERACLAGQAAWGPLTSLVSSLSHPEQVRTREYLHSCVERLLVGPHCGGVSFAPGEFSSIKWECVPSLFLTRLWETRINLPEQISESSHYYIQQFSPSYKLLALPTSDRETRMPIPRTQKHCLELLCWSLRKEGAGVFCSSDTGMHLGWAGSWLLCYEPNCCCLCLSGVQTLQP